MECTTRGSHGIAITCVRRGDDARPIGRRSRDRGPLGREIDQRPRLPRGHGRDRSACDERHEVALFARECGYTRRGRGAFALDAEQHG